MNADSFQLFFREVLVPAAFLAAVCAWLAWRYFFSERSYEIMCTDASALPCLKGTIKIAPRGMQVPARIAGLVKIIPDKIGMYQPKAVNQGISTGHPITGREIVLLLSNPDEHMPTVFAPYADQVGDFLCDNPRLYPEHLKGIRVLQMGRIYEETVDEKMTVVHFVRGFEWDDDRDEPVSFNFILTEKVLPDMYVIGEFREADVIPVEAHAASAETECCSAGVAIPRDPPRSAA